MHRTKRVKFRLWSLLSPCLSFALLAASAGSLEAEPPGADDNALARFVPANGLSIYVENNGLETEAASWQATATFKMLTETSLGEMIEDITTQLLARALPNQPGAPINAREAVAVLKHLGLKGFVIGYCGSIRENDTKAVVVAIRNAKSSQVFRSVVAKNAMFNEPAANLIEAPGDRQVFALQGPPIQWWFENDDAVFAFVPPGAENPVIPVLDGKAPSALTSPDRIKSEPGETLVGSFFVNVDALPPLPPDASKYGFDTVERIEGKVALRGPGIVTTVGVQAPRPRKGFLAVLDQPTLPSNSTISDKDGATTHALMSVDLLQFSDARWI